MFKNNTTLLHMTFMNNQMSFPDVAAIAKGLEFNNTLTCLSFYNNTITSDSIRVLEEVARKRGIPLTVRYI